MVIIGHLVDFQLQQERDDSMLDTPTNNFPTLNPGDKSLVGTSI